MSHDPNGEVRDPRRHTASLDWYGMALLRELALKSWNQRSPLDAAAASSIEALDAVDSTKGNAGLCWRGRQNVALGP
jgi:hypothetical protein